MRESKNMYTCIIHQKLINTNNNHWKKETTYCLHLCLVCMYKKIAFKWIIKLKEAFLYEINDPTGWSVIYLFLDKLSEL